MSTRPPRNRRQVGLNEFVERLFRAHPIGLPGAFIVVGGGILALQFARYGSPAGRQGAFAVIFLLVGLVLLPFGLRTAIRRRRNVIVLRCPRCGAESRSSARPFSIQRFPDVDYAYVVCSSCGKDFTVDKFARLE